MIFLKTVSIKLHFYETMVVHIVCCCCEKRVACYRHRYCVAAIVFVWFGIVPENTCTGMTWYLGIWHSGQAML